MMKRVLLGISLVVLVGTAPAASAATVQIQLGGVDLSYDGTDIVDSGSTSPDPLTNATFLSGNTLLGVDDTDVTLDLNIPVLNILATGPSSVSMPEISTSKECRSLSSDTEKCR